MVNIFIYEIHVNKFYSLRTLHLPANLNGGSLREILFLIYFVYCEHIYAYSYSLCNLRIRLADDRAKSPDSPFFPLLPFILTYRADSYAYSTNPLVNIQFFSA